MVTVSQVVVNVAPHAWTVALPSEVPVTVRVSEPVVKSARSTDPGDPLANVQLVRPPEQVAVSVMKSANGPIAA